MPQELRLCLEPALSEEPSQETLNKYLPTIRSIIFNLLNGLKQKQAAYKRLVAERQTDTPPNAASQLRPSTRLDVTSDDRLSSRSGGSSQGSVSPASTSSQLPPRVPSSQALAERQRAGNPARPAPPDAFRPARMRVPDANQPRRSASPTSTITDAPQIKRHQLVENPVPSSPPASEAGPPPPPKATPPYADRFSRDSFGNPRPISRFSADSDLTNGSPIRSPTSRSPPTKAPSLPGSAAVAPPTLPTLNLPSALQLSDTPLDSPGAETSSLPDVPPETRATLAALGRSDALERRASKRFSSFTFNKMLPGSPGHQKAATVGSPQRPTRRAGAPPMPPLPESVASSNLASVSKEDGRDRAGSPLDSSYLHANGSDTAYTQDRSGSPASTGGDTSTGSVRVVRTPDPEDIIQQSTPRPGDTTVTSISPAPTTGSLSVFFQVGRQVKKASLELPVADSALRLSFMERFEYDPGVEDFPAIYIRDHRTGVQFELEDMEDLREGSLLSLNIERESSSIV